MQIRRPLGEYLPVNIVLLAQCKIKLDKPYLYLDEFVDVVPTIGGAVVVYVVDTGYPCVSGLNGGGAVGYGCGA